MTTTDWSRATRLSAGELHACWAALDLGDTPTTLNLQHPPGRTVTEQRHIYGQTFAHLRRRGLTDPHADRTDRLDRPDRPGPALTAALRLLATATGEWDLWLSSGLVALGAFRGEHGLVVVQNPVVQNPVQNGTAETSTEYALLAMPAPRVPATLVELLGPLRPGQARPVNIPADALDHARRTAGDGSLWTLADRLIDHGVDRADAHSLARMCTGIQTTGQLGGLIRRDGVDHRTPWVVGIHRAAHGDYLQLRQPIPGGRPCVTIAPITADRLVDHLRQLVPAA
ncbi:MAG: ESX secretion-associated protein EspG [Actinomycetota bacterium]|nr:ESX secretion-associated protein EspG [Actinomycetota bacterium]